MYVILKIILNVRYGDIEGMILYDGHLSGKKKSSCV